ncbi:hypothetical protein TNCV_2455281 [Trichonephila clavipes]|nr:hypothetical protein TNCV_2455281 [Trichonephila clavipes]
MLKKKEVSFFSRSQPRRTGTSSKQRIRRSGSTQVAVGAMRLLCLRHPLLRPLQRCQVIWKSGLGDCYSSVRHPDDFAV